MSGDFRELYLLRRDEIPDLLASDGNQPQRDKERPRFVAKVAHEVGATTDALARLETRLTDICGRSSARRS